MEREHPHVIENNHGERLVFERIETREDGEYLVVSNTVQPGFGPPMHVHYRQRESLTVVSGRIGYQIAGENPVFAGPGETVEFQPGQAHKFWAEGDQELHCTGYITPPDNVEYFLSEIYRSTKESGNGRPNPFEAAYLLHQYRSEFGMMEIPAVVQTVVFPILRAIGRLTGKYARFENAPDPVES